MCFTGPYWALLSLYRSYFAFVHGRTHGRTYITTYWAAFAAKKIRGLGLLEPVGHFDFYPSDGGQHQYGCDSRYLWGSIGFAEASCNRDRAVLYYLHRWSLFLYKAVLLTHACSSIRYLLLFPFGRCCEPRPDANRRCSKVTSGSFLILGLETVGGGGGLSTASIIVVDR